MAFVNFPTPIVWPEALDWAVNGNPSLTTEILDAAGEKVGGVFRPVVAGNIAKVGFRVNTAATPATLDVRVETVDGSGNPSGTLWAANTNVVITPAAATWFWADLTADATVALTDIVGISLTPATTPINITINVGGNNLGRQTGLPYSALFTTGAWAKGTLPPNFAVEYSDGKRYFMHTAPLTFLDDVTSSYSETQNEIGNRFMLPFRAKCIGIMIRGGNPGNLWDLALRDSTEQLLALIGDSGTLRWDSDWSVNQSGIVMPYQAIFKTGDTVPSGGSVTLEPYTVYRITARPGSGAQGLTRMDFQVDSAETMRAHVGGLEWYQTLRANHGLDSGSADAAVTTTDTTLTDTRTIFLAAFTGSTIVCNGKTMVIISGGGGNLVEGTGWFGGGNPGNGFAWDIIPGPWADDATKRVGLYPILSAIDTAVAPVNISTAQVI